MHPILFEIGPFALHSYGLAMAVAFGLGIWIAMQRSGARGLGDKYAMDLSVMILIFSLLGARISYVFTHLEEFRQYPLDAISPIQHNGKIGIAGLVLLGGVVAGFATAYVFGRRRQVPFLVTTDIFVPSLALGIAIGRIGCFFNGCCFGLPTELPWCMHFPAESIAGGVFPETCLHPTQLYECLWMLLTFGFLLGIDRRPRGIGRVTGWFLLLNGTGRFYVESLRWYEQSMIVFQGASLRITISQLVSLGLALTGLVLLFRRLPLPRPSEQRAAEHAKVRIS
ncbi:prolipoprotein diacylglyceryl transferase [candidate division KSB1 bacterium]|nr:prolipoprotein diacylglyceryl transferase [candidate division KSB1 bacterium]